MRGTHLRVCVRGGRSGRPFSLPAHARTRALHVSVCASMSFAWGHPNALPPRLSLSPRVCRSAFAQTVTGAQRTRPSMPPLLLPFLSPHLSPPRRHGQLSAFADHARGARQSSSTAQRLRETFLPLSLCRRRCRWRVCACTCDMPLPLTSLARASASPCAVAGSTTTGTAVAAGSSSGADCYVIVWVEGRERPVYACTAPLPSSGPSASLPSAASAGAAAVPAVNVVTLRRFFAALVLLSSPPPTARARAGGHCEALSCAASFTQETAPVLRATLPLGLVGAFGASPPYYYVAVLAPSTAAVVGNQLLAWLASSVLAALHPDSWATAVSPTGQARGTALLSLAADAPDLCSQLALYGAAEVGRARAGAAAMEDYGVREVLADSAGQSSLAAVLQEFEPCRDSPVAVAISTLLGRC